MKPLVSLRQALSDPDLLGSALPGPSWSTWRTILLAVMGEELTAEEAAVYRELSGRDYAGPIRPDEFFAVMGRRSGKTRAIGVAAVYQAALNDYADVLAPGQRARLPILAATKQQAVECHRFILGTLQAVPLLAEMLDGDPTQDEIRLVNGVDIVITAASFRGIRGSTFIGCIADEIAFWRIEDAANPDREVLRAVRPGLATTSGQLFVISSPYSKRGELWENYRRHYGPNGNPSILVVQAETLRMHRTAALERQIARAFENDPEAAKAEWGGEFRDGISDFVSPEVVDACTDVGVSVREPVPGVRYHGFIDAAGGSGQDSQTMAVCHRNEDGTAVLDFVAGAAPPFSPEAVCEQFAKTFKLYGVRTIIGDSWGGDYVKSMMGKFGVTYIRSDKPKSAIYAEFLPLLNSRKVRLLDQNVLRKQLLGLERRTAWGGKDSIDHSPNSSDDWINSAAGALVSIGSKPAPLIIPKELVAQSAMKPSRGPFGREIFFNTQPPRRF
ncbi:hypothetical protein [Methylobacterium nigriterrae]|uniref:hypothetical protein n=1 Tax=Methylobacterium nigriterrae TaxID=3127512 RepID=UPI003013FA1E